MDECKQKPAGIMQPSVDKIVNLAMESGLATRRIVLARHCGIHPDNRGGSGVDPFNAQNLVLKISKQGYSETKLEQPMGFEKALSGTRLHDVQKAFNERNFAEANGYLRKLDFRDIEYLPATCSHTAAAINIIEGGGPGLHEELCNAEGNVDIAKVLALCPSWEQAIKDGMPCIVFKRELEAACPELPAFLSKAGNQSHEVDSKETKVQLMQALNLHFTSLKTADKKKKR